MAPWEKISWPRERLHGIYHDWATFFSNKRQITHAFQYVNRMLELQPDDDRALLKRSHLSRKIGMAQSALLDCQRAEEILKERREKYGLPTYLQLADPIYEANKFEDYKVSLHDSKTRYPAAKLAPIKNRIAVVDSNFDDTLSNKVVGAVQDLVTKMISELSKTPIEEGTECDVVSIVEKEEEHLSPLEIARRKRQFKIFNQTYLNKSWVDVAFLKKIRDNPNMLISQCKVSSPFLYSLANEKTKTISAFTKMLHTRCPLYCARQKNSANMELHQKTKQENLYRIQYQTRRNMFKILKSIRHLICMGELDKLTEFVEEVMGNYVAIKTNRIMPWKFEFINEVFNLLGMARVGVYKLPSNLKFVEGKQRLLKLFRLPVDKTAEMPEKGGIQEFIFNRKPEANDPKTTRYKRRVTRLENRMRFAKFSIERCYILYEIAQAHLENNAFDAACSMARNAISEARNCRSHIWYFLCLMVICKSDAILCKVEREREVLTEAFLVAQALRNLDVCVFIDVCLRINAEEWELKKMTAAPEYSFQRKRGKSMSADTSPTNLLKNQ